MNIYKKKKFIIVPAVAILLGIIVGLSFGLPLGLLTNNTNNNENNKTNPYVTTIKQKEKSNFGFAAKSYFEDESKWNLSYKDDVEAASLINLPNKTLMKNKANMMYQMNVYGFSDGDGDGIGDLWGAYKKISYLEKLNVGSVWLSPINISPFYHGYDVMDFTSVSSELGGMRAFNAFLWEAHNRGIKVYLDMVFNHTSTKHPWFAKAVTDGDDKEKYEKYYTFGNQFKWSANQAGYEDSLQRFFSTFDNSIMADLRFENPSVLEELQNVIKFWVKKGVDGFRFDAFKHFLEDQEVNKLHPIYLGGIAEIFYHLKEAANEQAMAIGRPINDIQFFGEGLGVTHSNVLKYSNYINKNGDSFPALDGAYDAKFWSNGKWTVLEGNEPSEIETYVNQLKGEAKGPNRVIPWMPYLSNHDTERWIEHVRKYVDKNNRPSATDPLTENDKSLLKSAFLTSSMVPGRPIIYQGDELGYHGDKTADTDINVREPLTWENQNEISFKTLDMKNSFIRLNQSKDVGTVDKNLGDTNSIVNHLREYLKIRGQYPWLSTSSILRSLGSIGLSQRDGGIRINDKNSSEKIIFIGTNAFDLIRQNKTSTKYDLSKFVGSSKGKVLFKSKNVIVNEDTWNITVPITGTIILRVW